MQNPELAQKLLDENFAPWVLALAPRVVSIGPEGAVIDIPVTPEIARVGGMVCGQAIATLADTTMVMASAGHLGEFRPVATTNLETRFLSAARGQALRCTARVIKAGRALVFAEAQLQSQPDYRPVAHAAATMVLPGSP